MDEVKAIEKEIELLTERVNSSDKNAEIHIERAKLYLRLEQFDKALNDFIIASEIQPESAEIKQHINMIKSIFNYRNIDIYNP